MIKIIHFSDWHTIPQMVPPADLYICTGDMLPNYPLVEILTDKGRIINWDPYGPDIDPTIPKYKRPNGYIMRRILDAKRERKLQDLWVDKNKGWRKYLGSPDAPVYIVRGNHDFTTIKPLFGDDVHEFNDHTEIKELHGLKFTGMRGVPFIGAGWSDELSAQELSDRVAELPLDVDVLLTHSPPEGILDAGYGCNSLASYVNKRNYGTPLKLMCMGHIHEKHGLITQGSTIFSNAATTYKIIKL